MLILRSFSDLTNATFTTSDYGLTTLSTNGSSDNCWCDCYYVISPPTNMTQEQLLKAIQRIYNELLLNKNNISASVRKRISIPDYRPSAQSIGYVGVLVLVTTLGSIVALDFTTLLKDVGSGLGNLKRLVSRNNFTDISYQNEARKDGDVDEEKEAMSLTSKC